MDYLTGREQGTAGAGALFSTRNSAVEKGKRRLEVCARRGWAQSSSAGKSTYDGHVPFRFHTDSA